MAQNTSDLQLIDQTNITGSPVVLNSDPAGLALTDRNISTVLNRFGSADVPTDEPFIGNLAELIVYNNEVDNSYVPNARNQIFSYLGMKYGVHLGISLLSSTGATVWNATANSAYNNAVFGVAEDNTSGLLVLQSNSSSSGSGNGTGISGAGNITLSVGSIGADQSFLMTGNDNGALTETTSNIPTAANGSSRLQRNWKVANTNNVGPVNLNFDFTGLTVSGTIGTTTDFRLMVNSAGDPTFATGTTEFYTPSGFTGNVANFSSVNLPDGSVFGVISDASAGTPLPVNFISFTAQPNGSNVDLNWVVGDNQQAVGYEVDHSTDGVNFTRIGAVPNSLDQTSYSFVQANAAQGKHYYRILETDQNGNSIYSKVDAITILVGSDFSVTMLNNPAAGNTDAQLQINAANAGTAMIELWSAAGSRIAVLQQGIGTGTTTIAVPMSHLPAGSYVVKVAMNNGTQTHVVQVVKL